MNDFGQANKVEDLSALTAQAEKAVCEEDWVAAAAAYERLIKRKPHNADNRFMLAKAYEELGRVAEAIELFKDPSISGLEKAKKRLARIYIDAKDYAAAIPLVEVLIASNPNDQKFAKWYAACLERGGGDRATAERLQLGQNLVENGELREAEQLYLDLIRAHPNLARVYLQLGQIYIQQKRWQEAVGPLRSGLAIDPDNRKMRNALARTLIKIGDINSAVEVLQDAVGRADDVDGRLLLQRCFIELGEWELANATADQLSRMIASGDPLHADFVELKEEAAVRQELAAIGTGARNGGDSAILQYRGLVERHPHSMPAWLALSSGLSREGRYAEAADALRAAETCLPDNLEVRAALSKAFIDCGDEQIVLRHFEAAAAIGRSGFEGLRWLAHYYAAREDWAAVCNFAEKALKLHPSSSSARVLLVRSLWKRRHFDDALRVLETLLESGQKRGEALQLKADILVDVGRVDEAIKLYCEALRLSRKDPALVDRLNTALSMASRAELFPLKTLEALQLAISPFDIQNAIAPFIRSEAHRSGWEKREGKVWRQAIDRIAAAGSGIHRDRATIETEYSVWSTMSFDRYRTNRANLTGSPWIWREKKLLLDGAAAARFRTLMLGAVIRQLKPRRVLEVGSGNGINLLSMAGAFPETEFVGLELTREGVAQAQRAQGDAAARHVVEAYTMLDIVDPSALARITFTQGDASQMPYPDNSFDLVMTVLAVEQMEAIRSTALSEIARVSGGHVAMLEPFRDANQEGLKALYVRSRGYFQGSVAELRDFGIEPVWATSDFPQESFLGSVFVLGKKLTSG